MLLISHRGYIPKYPENSLIGIKYAFDLKEVDGVEFDVRITKDRKFVLIHDFFIDRVSSGSGIVSKLSYRKLLKYNFGNKKNHVKVTRLENVLKINSDKIFLLEIKFDYKEYKKVKYKLLILLKQNENKNIYICSFNKDIINDLKKYKLNFKYGYVVFKNIKKINIDFYAMNYMFYSKEIREKMDDKLLFLWTINNKNDITNIRQKFLGVVTDYPLSLKE